MSAEQHGVRMPTELRMRAVADLISYARNARVHDDAQVEQLAESMLTFGYTNPILTAGNKILAGHGRVMALEKLNVTHAPTIDLSHLTEEQQRLLILADNKLALNASWDEAMLKVELGALRDLDLDLSLTGFSDDEIDRLLAEIEPPADEPPEPPDSAAGTQGCELVVGADFVEVTARKDGQVLTSFRAEGLTGEQARAVHQLAELLAASRGDPERFEDNVQYVAGIYDASGRRAVADDDVEVFL